MKPTDKSGRFPVFEANQILSHTHLNQLFDYLDEQGRLTRANLTGIGIVCGLDVSWNSDRSAVNISAGCGITSEGYLIVEPQNITLEYYREYTIPGNIEYGSFMKDTGSGREQYKILELLSQNDPAAGSSDQLKDLADDEDYSQFYRSGIVLLFLELKMNDLRTCGPATCDDNGAAVTAVVRRLLIKADDIDAINSAVEETRGLSQAELADALSDRLSLPDIRMPRYDVPDNDGITGTADLLRGFYNAAGEVFRRTDAAIDAAYNAFKPLVGDITKADLSDILMTGIGITGTVDWGEIAVYLQNYYDFFNDLINAYDEFRWKGVNLICACSPPDSLFPRHLMLGAISPNELSSPEIYRQQFLRSPAVAECCKDVDELRQLFRRMMEMIRSFSYKPDLATSTSIDLGIKTADNQIRITPDRSGDVLLSDKAIPYYYRFKNRPVPLYKLWSAEKTRRNRSHLNLGYRSVEYNEPAAPEFVKSPLQFNIEPYNFLRVEGHLGKSYASVVKSLAAIRDRFRLPVRIVALHTGVSGADSLQDFLEKHPGIQHRSGVPVGGTFIVVYHKGRLKLDGGSVLKEYDKEDDSNSSSISADPDRREIIDALNKLKSKRAIRNDPEFNAFYEKMAGEASDIKGRLVNGFGSDNIFSRIAEGIRSLKDGTVVADFFLPYISDDTVSECTCRSARECEYEWIDSIRHINNLLFRHYRLNATGKAPASAELEKSRLNGNYIIRIYRYEIQGQSMMGGKEFIDLTIPKTALAKNRLSAVAQKFNESFPAGLVFDCRQGTNSILIRHIDGHSFRIELAGLQGNQIVYAYDDKNMYRKQNGAWEAMNDSCECASRVLGGSYSSRDYTWLYDNYKPIYQSPVAAPTSSEVIKWEKMTLARARKFQLVSLPVYKLLQSIRGEIYRIDPDAKVVLAGSWANGSWITRNQSPVENGFADSGDLQEFLKLRERVTGKTGFSDIDLIVDSLCEITSDMIKISTGYTIRILKGKKDAQRGFELRIQS